MATDTHGKLEEYCPEEKWEEYIERFEQYFAANEINDADKKSNLANDMWIKKPMH